MVVDPGVGSARRGIAAEAGDYRFVAPDNGVLTAVLDEQPPKRVVELTERRYARPTVSRTFEGRDRFAPAAAWLAQGHRPRPRSAARPARSTGSSCRSRSSTPIGIDGEVLRVDRFGNLITNIDRQDVRDAGGRRRSRSASAAIEVPRVVSTYADAAPGEVCALFGSTDHLEIAANGASAAAALDLGPRRARARRPARVIAICRDALP